MDTSSAPHTDSLIEDGPPTPALHGVMFALAAAALLVAIFLTASSLASGVQPPGCGAGSGCDRVLTSQWSRVLGIPVSMLASGLYLLALIGLLAIGRTAPSIRQAGWMVLLLASTAILAAAAWFVYVQAAWLQAWCPWCLVDHGLGVVLAGLILWQAPWRSQGFSMGRWRMASGGLGVLLVGTMAGIQLLTPAPTFALPGIDLQLNVAEEPHLGDPEDERLVAVLVDYTCPRCRGEHAKMLEARAQMDEPFTLLILPMSIHPDCNQHITVAPPEERFRESCALARLALAVHAADPSEFAAFDTWLFEPERPRSEDEARAKAVQLVGRQPLERALAGSGIEQRLQRNADIHAQVQADQVPVIFLPGQTLIGRLDLESLHAAFSDAR